MAPPVDAGNQQVRLGVFGHPAKIFAKRLCRGRGRKQCKQRRSPRTLAHSTDPHLEHLFDQLRQPRAVVSASLLRCETGARQFSVTKEGLGERVECPLRRRGQQLLAQFGG